MFFLVLSEGFFPQVSEKSLYFPLLASIKTYVHRHFSATFCSSNLWWKKLFFSQHARFPENTASVVLGFQRKSCNFCKGFLVLLLWEGDKWDVIL